jgi:FKBP-type peptidyl-prolyl cis-trans isomerase
MGEDTTDKEALVNRLLAVIGLAALMACGGDSGTTSTPTGPTSLQIEDVVVGTGATVVAGDTITINYIGTFLDGRVFDQSTPGQPVTFPRPIGVGNFIPGFDQGLLGMKVGGRRKLTIPSSLAYGAAGVPPTIPPNTPLAFDVTLVAIAGK